MYRKYFSLIFILLPFFFISCKKESTPISSAIIGTWELRTAYNGWTGTTNYPPGNGNYFKFTNSAFEIDTNRVIVASGTYMLVKSKSNLTGKMGYRIIYNHEENSGRTFINILHDSLTISDDSYDGGGGLYIRIE